MKGNIGKGENVSAVGETSFVRQNDGDIRHNIEVLPLYYSSTFISCENKKKLLKWRESFIAI